MDQFGRGLVILRRPQRQFQLCRNAGQRVRDCIRQQALSLSGKVAFQKQARVDGELRAGKKVANSPALNSSSCDSTRSTPGMLRSISSMGYSSDLVASASLIVLWPVAKASPITALAPSYTQNV